MLALAGLAAVAGGCAAPSSRETATPAPAMIAQRVAGVLAGEYAGRVIDAQAAEQSGDRFGSSSELVRFEARRVDGPAGAVAVRLVQRAGDDPARHFMLVLEPTSVATRLTGRFSPLDARGNPTGTCPMEVSVQSDGFVARTNAATCRFGDAGQTVALVKEIAHDGQRLVIGDRVVDPSSGQARMPDRVLELHRVRRFSGWAGVRDVPDGPWRVDASLELSSDGTVVRPADAGDMTLGIELELAPYRVGDNGEPVLRLRAFDIDTGRLLGQSWADPGAVRLGLALPDLQIGLRIADSR